MRKLALLLALVALATVPRSGFAAPPADNVGHWQLPGDPILRARPGTELRVLGQPQEIEVSAGRKRPVYTVLVKSGSVDVEVPKGAESAVALSAPRKLTVLVRSGR